MDKLLASLTWDLAPEVIPGFSYLRWYSLFWAFGVYLGFIIMTRIFRKEGLDLGILDKLVLTVMIGLVIGARLGHILFYDPVYYLNNPIEILPIKIDPHFEFTGLHGLASHGGVAGALIGLWVFNRKYQLGFLWSTDRLIVAGALLGGFIRLGNFFNSEIIGLPAQVPWAVVFFRIDLIPRHPAQLYEAAFYFVVFLLLYQTWKRKRFSNTGFLTGLGLVLIFAQRFFIEFLKENQTPFESGMALNMGQLLSIPVLVFGLFMLILKRKAPKLDHHA
ncbi:MAG: prolipoprotein diacylglyceryl transferase [Bacteroidota bacterium]